MVGFKKELFNSGTILTSRLLLFFLSNLTHNLLVLVFVESVISGVVCWVILNLINTKTRQDLIISFAIF